jgi:gluconokinase
MVSLRRTFATAVREPICDNTRSVAAETLEVQLILIVMGVAGSGKTTVGALLADELGWRFADADDFHLQANKDKISRGIALTDADRGPWLAAMRSAIIRWDSAGESVVLACSALKRSYRDELRAGPVQFVFLKGDPALLMDRLRSRRGHFASEKILASQLVTLEEPGDDESVIVVPIDLSPEESVSAIIAKLSANG